MKKSEFITIEEFSKMYDVKVSTVKKRINEIYIAKKINNEWFILKGTRYPYRKIRKIKKDKVYITILKAIEERKYIDEKYFKIYKEDFYGILKILEDEKYIKKVKTLNNYGANKYITTMLGSKVIKEKNISFNFNINNNFGINF